MQHRWGCGSKTFYVVFCECTKTRKHQRTHMKITSLLHANTTVHSTGRVPHQTGYSCRHNYTETPKRPLLSNKRPLEIKSAFSAAKALTAFLNKNQTFFRRPSQTRNRQAE